MTPTEQPRAWDHSRLPSDPDLLAVACEILWWGNAADDEATFLASVLPCVHGVAQAEFIAVVAAIGGQWRPIAQTGVRRPLPVELLAEALDQQRPCGKADWGVFPLGPAGRAVDTLCVHWRTSTSAVEAQRALEPLVGALAEALIAVRRKHQLLQRSRRLEAMLQAANRWFQTRDVEPLLQEIAEAATRLLGADRASIFLWDKRAKTLVGRPALGVPGGELRIPDDRGVVGRVIHSGQPLRIDASSAMQQYIDRQVDAQLGYQTRTLLCVPLRGSSGELLGAFELINKQSGDFTEQDEAALTELAAHAAVALENVQDRQQLLSTSRQLTEQAAARVQLIGESPAIEALRSMIRRVAATDLAVLILGENGTGKEVVAQLIHYLSRRREKPLIAVNCAAIPDTLAESELFGHERGAFTDAHETRPGKFELAREGTLLLDEVGELSPSAQAKLLRVLEERVLVRVGGSTPIPTDARIVAATNQDLSEMVRQRRFREDLYFRLNVVTLEIPPLRQRPGDILLLAEHFLREFCARARRPVLQLSDSARERLLAHPWPGNVRELRNLMERLAYLSPSEVIDAADLAFILAPRAMAEPSVEVGPPLGAATAQFQTEYIRRAIAQAGGNLSQAAARLGLHRSNLYRKMRQLRMSIPE